MQRSQRLPVSLAIDSSTRFASVALAVAGEVVRFIPLDRHQRTAATISLALNDLLETMRAAGDSLDYVAVTDGPGSFTGLRIGVTTAKSLAYALDCPIVAVDSLAVLASELWSKSPAASEAMVAINAYRGQVFAANWTALQWRLANETGDFSTQSAVVEANDWASSVLRAKPTILIAAEPAIAGRFEATRVIELEPSAIAVAKLAHVSAQQQRFVSAFDLLPRYLRDSAAEEKLTSTNPSAEQALHRSADTPVTDTQDHCDMLRSQD